MIPVVIVTGIAVTSCAKQGGGSPAASAATSATGTGTGQPTSAAASPAASGSPIPAGYTRVGGAAQGISIAAPTSWVTINLAKESIQSAAKKVSLKGISSTALIQDMESLQKLHALFVFDVKAAVDSPQHFAPNLSAYCGSSGVTDSGAAGLPLIKTGMAAELQKQGATNVTQKDVKVGGVPGAVTYYQLSTTAGQTIYGSQLEVLPKSDKVCFVTLTMGKGQSLGYVLGVAASTAKFS